jgi:hypothetical protein
VAGVLDLRFDAGDPEAKVALQRVLRVLVAAHRDDIVLEELGRVVLEIVGDGDIPEIAQRVTWLVFIVAAIFGERVEEGDAEDAADRICELGQRIETKIEALLARLAAPVGDAASDFGNAADRRPAP